MSKEIFNKQIESLKNKGVKFVCMNEDEAVNYLMQANYFFRIKCYLNNFERDQDGKYDVDFLVLKELSTIDMYLRKWIISTTLDMEHLIKTKIMLAYTVSQKDITKEDIILFLEKYPHIDQKIKSKMNSSKFEYKRSLFEKYHNEWEIWALLEILDIGSLIKLIEYFKIVIDIPSNLLYSFRTIRNAAAHNSTLLSNLQYYPDFKMNKLLRAKLGALLPVEEFKKYIKNPFITDLLILIYMLGLFKEENTIKKRTEEFHDLISNRCVKNTKDFGVSLIEIHHLVTVFFLKISTN